MVRPNPMRPRCGHAVANTVNLNHMDRPRTTPAESPDDGRRRWVAAAVGLVCAIVFLFAADPFLSPPDCVSYWAWGESLLRDADLAFSNQYAMYEMPRYYVYATGTGRLANDWPAGSGYALLPALPFGRVAAQAWVCAMALAALAFAFPHLSRCTKGKVFAAAAMVLGTPLFFYLACGPFFSHAVSFACVTTFVVLWARTREGRRAEDWLLLGLLLGAAALVRPQNGALAVVFLAEAGSLAQAFGGVSALLRLGAGALLGFAPAMVGYLAIYGGPLTLPKSEEMHWLSPNILGVLLSDYHGVLPWTPVHVLGLAGLAAVFRKDRVLGVGLVLLFAAQLYLNAANVVWWCGGSFGNRRLVDVAIVVAFGLGALWDGSSGRWRGALVAAVLACLAWTSLLLLAERRLLVPLDRYVPFDAEFVRALSRTIATPVETIWSLARPFVEASSSVSGMSVRVACAAGLGMFSWWIARRALSPGVPDAPVPRPAIAASVAGACVLAAWVGIAASRTPPMPEESLARAGRQPGILWDNYVELAHYHVVRKDYEGAKAAALRALAIRPGTPTPLWYLALAAHDAGHEAEAAEAAARVLEINPGHPGASGLMAKLKAKP